jgi:hypothetical protein
MVIKFLCPNGHQLNAPENMAGKKGKCPKCQSAFVVPTLEEVAAAEAEAESESVPQDQAVSAEVSAGESPAVHASGSGVGPAGADLFVFLCPNGHRLNGPPSLKGKPGQCPHCGARFRIPTDDEEEAPQEELPGGERPMQVVVGAPESGGSGGFRFPIEQFAPQEGEPSDKPPSGAPGLGYIFGKLWRERDDDSEVEIFLSEGEILAPDHFSAALSNSDYGVFAMKEGDGSYAVTVVPWSAVRRVGVRKLGELPGELFT